MKNIFVAFSVLIMSCQVEENTPVIPDNNSFDPSKAVLIKQGELMGAGGHTASGVASLYSDNGKYVVYLDPYNSQNGPDLKVYLSKDEAATEYIRLGNLKSIMGSQSYTVPVDINQAEYTHIHVWCEKFSVVFAVAEIK
jgi:hypothetical protein